MNFIPEELREYMSNYMYRVHCDFKRNLVYVYKRGTHQVVAKARLNIERRNTNDKRTENRNG